MRKLKVPRWQYNKADYLAGLVAYPWKVRKLARYLAENAAEDGKLSLGQNYLRDTLARELGLTRDDIGETFASMRKHYALIEIVEESEHWAGKPRSYQLLMTASPVTTRKVEPIFRPEHTVIKYRNDPRTGAFVPIEDDAEDETHDGAGSASDYDSAA